MIPFFLMLAAILVARGVGAIGWQPLADWQMATRVGLAVMFCFGLAMILGLYRSIEFASGSQELWQSSNERGGSYVP